MVSDFAKQNRAGNLIWQFAFLMAAIGGNCKAESHCPLLLDVKPFTSHNENRLSTLIHFGQENHVRYYGADVRDRIRAAGFGLKEFVASEPDVSRYGLLRGETIFVASKPPS